MNEANANVGSNGGGGAAANGNGNTMKTVYTVVERSPGKSHWTRVGVGFVNRDGSINLKLDAVPVNGTLQIRDWEPADRLARGQTTQVAAQAAPSAHDAAPF
jgi:hypothetical protein